MHTFAQCCIKKTDIYHTKVHKAKTALCDQQMCRLCTPHAEAHPDDTNARNWAVADPKKRQHNFVLSARPTWKKCAR